MKALYSFPFILLVFSTQLFSQENETVLFKNSNRNERYNAGSPVFSPIILPAYSPEMGFVLTGGCLVSFKTKKNNDYLKHSRLTVLINSDLKEGRSADLNLNSYWFDDRLILNLNAMCFNRTDHYWGIGFNKAEEIEKGDITTRYHIKYKKITPSLSLKILNKLYTGIKFDHRSGEPDEFSDLMLEDIDILKDSNKLVTAGIGIFVFYDSRNFITSPTKGFYLNIEGINYNEYLGGHYKYQVIGIDYRHYIPLFRKGSVIAWQLNSRLGSGNIPWTELQTLGTSYDLKGYFYGQYRDKSMAYALIEYRHTFNGSNSDGLSRHGFVFWVGTGTVFPEIGELNNTLFNTGFGYRFELQPHNNLRVDLGFGSKSSGLFVNYSETF